MAELKLACSCIPQVPGTKAVNAKVHLNRLPSLKSEGHMFPVTNMVAKGSPISKAAASRVYANADVLAIVEGVKEGVGDINSVTSVTVLSYKSVTRNLINRLSAEKVFKAVDTLEVLRCI